MRLGQLSRKISIKPDAIVEEIQTEFGETITKGLNTKLDDRFVEYFESKYEISTSGVEEKEETTNTIVPEEAKEEPKEEPVETKEIKEEVTENKEEKAVVETSEEEEEIELIKAPKIKLDGVKVIDKIDLPEPKPQFIEIDGVIVDKNEYKKSQEFKKKEEERKKRAQKKAKESKEKKEIVSSSSVNEFAIKEQKQKEKERLIEKRRRESEERERELRKEHYKNQVAKVAPKPKPKKKKKTEEPVQKAEEPIVHRNWIAKLIHWFKTE